MGFVNLDVLPLYRCNGLEHPLQQFIPAALRFFHLSLPVFRVVRAPYTVFHFLPQSFWALRLPDDSLYP